MKRRNMHLGAKPSLFRNAYQLRNNPTEAEKILWQYLKDRQIEGVRFRRQHSLKNFIPDFYGHQVKLAIELDGGYHNEMVQKLYDNDKDDILRNSGLTVLRYSNEEVIFEIEKVLNSIRKTILEIKGLK